MGLEVGVKNTGRLADLISFDGREFGSLHENLRDALLAESAIVQFGIIGLENLAGDPTPRVAKRAIFDDGTGMDENTLRNVYFWLSETGTKLGFDLTVDEVEKKINISVAVAKYLGKMHERRGIGGRVTLTRWNPLGVVTVTIHKGIARMVQMYRTLEGKIEMRTWYEEGIKTPIVDPYGEPELLTYDDIHADLPYARRLLFASGMAANEDAADAIIKAMGADDGLPNPMADYDWESVVPEWIGTLNEDDGLWYRHDGTLAHGTIKILLGDKVTDSTALTGDPMFPNEAIASRYNGAISSAWLDLSEWDVRVWAITPETDGDKAGDNKKSHNWFKLVGHGDKQFRLDSGKPNDRAMPSGRRQLGSLAYRVSDPKAVLHTEILDLGKYGTAFLVVNDPKHPGGGFEATSRRGTVAMVYGNELHGLSDTDKLTPSDYQYRNMGISTMTKVEGKDGKMVDLYKFVSIYIIAPLATDTEEGIFQEMARDNLKWSGRDKLPLAGEGGINAAIQQAFSDDFIALFHSDSADTAVTSVSAERYQHIADLRAEAAKGGADKVESEIPTLGEKPKPTLAEDPAGTETGSKIVPGTEHVERPDINCDKCAGIKLHEPKCPNRRAGGGGGGGGTVGTFTKIDPSADGAEIGRKTRARKHPTPSVPTKVTLLPPHIEFVDTPLKGNDDELDATWPVVWEHPASGLKPSTEAGHEGETSTGTIYVYRHHLAVQTCFAIGKKAKRSEKDTIEAVEMYIKVKLADMLIGSLSMADLNMNTVKGKKPEAKLTLTQVADMALDTAQWFIAVSSISADEKALTSFVTANSAVKRTRRAPKPKAA